MSLTFEELSQALPAYAKDLKLNLSSVLRQTELTPQQTWGTAVASALASRNKDVYAAIVGEGAKNLSPEALEGAKAAGAIMGMNNVYYRFQHLVEKGVNEESIAAAIRIASVIAAIATVFEVEPVAVPALV